MAPKAVPSFGLDDTTGTRSQGDDRISCFPVGAVFSGSAGWRHDRGLRGWLLGQAAVRGRPSSVHVSATQ